MIDKINIISFKSNPNKRIFLNPKYTISEMKSNTYTILGGSRSEGSALRYMGLCDEIVTTLVKDGKYIVTGNGDKGIMGAAYDAAAQHSSRAIKTNKPLQNLTIEIDPPYGNERSNCVIIGRANSEIKRSKKFTQVSNNFLIFPGRATTIQEGITLIRENDYKKQGVTLNKIILVGKTFWEHLLKHYQNMEKNGDLNHKVSELFSLVNSKKGMIRNL